MKTKKFSLSIVGFLLLLFGLIAASVLVRRKQLIPQKAAGQNASLTLPNSLEINPQTQPEFTAPLFINTDSADIGGVDIVIDFSRDRLSLVDINPQASSSTTLKTFAPVKTDGLFDKVSVIQKANETGRLEFRAVTFDWQKETLLSPFNGVLGISNPFATLTFSVNQNITLPSQTTLTLLHRQGSTTDCNLVSSQNAADILAQANSSKINLNSATSTKIPASTSTLSGEKR